MKRISVYNAKIKKGTDVLDFQICSIRKEAIQVNLFDEKNADYAKNYACSLAEGVYASEGGNRLTFFFPVEPNSRYKYTCDTVGDRFGIYVSKNELTLPINAAAINAACENNGTTAIVALSGNNDRPKKYEFVTGADSKWAWIYMALNERPTGVKIVKLGGTV